MRTKFQEGGKVPSAAEKTGELGKKKTLGLAIKETVGLN